MPQILVVEDEPLIAMMLDDWLTESGHQTVGPAQSVAMALGLLESTRIDAAILDVTLGDDDCFAVAEALTKKGIPFAFATGHAAQSIHPQFKDVLTLGKPFDYATVTALLEKLLSRTTTT